MRQNFKTAATVRNRTEFRDIMCFLWKMWSTRHLKLNLICNCVHVYGWVAEAGGSDVGGSTSWIHTSVKDAAATTVPMQSPPWHAGWGLGMTIICTTATCVCAIVRMKNLICFYLICSRALNQSQVGLSMIHKKDWCADLFSTALKIACNGKYKSIHSYHFGTIDSHRVTNGHSWVENLCASGKNDTEQT